MKMREKDIIQEIFRDYSSGSGNWLNVRVQKNRAAEDDSQISALSERTTSVNINRQKEQKKRSKFGDKGDDSFGDAEHKGYLQNIQGHVSKTQAFVLYVLRQRFTLEVTNFGVICKYMVDKATNLDMIN